MNAAERQLILDTARSLRGAVTEAPELTQGKGGGAVAEYKPGKSGLGSKLASTGALSGGPSESAVDKVIRILAMGIPGEPPKSAKSSEAAAAEPAQAEPKTPSDADQAAGLQSALDKMKQALDQNKADTVKAQDTAHKGHMAAALAIGAAAALGLNHLRQRVQARQSQVKRDLAQQQMAQQQQVAQQPMMQQQPQVVHVHHQTPPTPMPAPPNPPPAPNIQRVGPTITHPQPVATPSQPPVYQHPIPGEEIPPPKVYTGPPLYSMMGHLPQQRPQQLTAPAARRYNPPRFAR